MTAARAQDDTQDRVIEGLVARYQGVLNAVRLAEHTHGRLRQLTEVMTANPQWQVFKHYRSLTDALS